MGFIVLVDNTDKSAAIAVWMSLALKSYWADASVLRHATARNRILARVQIRQQFQAQARFVVERNRAVFDDRQFGHEFFVPTRIEGADAFLNQRVRRMQRQVRARGPHDGPSAIVWRDG